MLRAVGRSEIYLRLSSFGPPNVPNPTKMQTQNDIPLYSAEGICIGRRTAAWAIWARESRVALIVTKRSTGIMMEAHMLQPDGVAGVLSSAPMAQPYVFNELLPCGGHAFRHKKLPKVKNEEEAHRIFRAVQVSCVV